MTDANETVWKDMNENVMTEHDSLIGNVSVHSRICMEVFLSRGSDYHAEKTDIFMSVMLISVA